MNDWNLELMLSGGGWGSAWGMDIKLLMDCSITVNASYFFPFDPPLKDEDGFVALFDVSAEGDIEPVALTNGSVSDGGLGRIPPRKYKWQQFPVLNVSCDFGVGGFKFL